MDRSKWPQIGDWVEIAESPKVPTGPTYGIVMSLYVKPDGAGAYVVGLGEDGKPNCRTGCAIYYLTKTGRVATPEEIKAIRDDDDLDGRDTGHLIAECARLREYCDVLDVLRRSHPEAVRTLRAWYKDGRPKLPPLGR